MLPRHQRALDAVVSALHEEFGGGLAGLLLTGSVARGEADEHSDLDIYVLVDRPWRQRRTRWVDGVEVELFVNPVSRIDASLTDPVDAHCAHMFATGTVLHDRDGDVARLVDSAGRVIAAGPPALSGYDRLMARYRPADLLRDAHDVADDPEACDSMLSLALWVTLEVHYAATRRWWPKQKRVLRDLESWDGDTAALARGVLDTTTEREERLGRMADLVERVLEPLGGRLHEWESDPEPVDPDGGLDHR